MTKNFLVGSAQMIPRYLLKVQQEALFGSKLLLWTRSRTAHTGCDLSQVSLPRLDAPKTIIGQKQRHILYSRKQKTRRSLSLLLCQSCCLKSRTPSFLRLAAGDSDIIGTRVRLPSNHHAWRLIASTRQTP